MMKEMFDKIVYAFFPRRCEFCGDVVPLTQKRCDSCQNLSRIASASCRDCGKALDDCTCKNGKHDKPDYDCIIAPFVYKDHVAAAIHKFKFGGYSELAKAFSEEMIAVIKNKYPDINFDAVTYVPISEKREKKRGYNQSRLLAQNIADELNLPLENVLYKAYDAPSQRKFNARQRKANVFGAFDVQEEADVHNKIYLIVDDVKTTGATISECSAVLKSYGASSVYAVTLAIR